MTVLKAMACKVDLTAGAGATNGSGAAAAAGVGVVPLPPELVAGALSDAALALLAPQPLSLRLSLQPAGAG